MPAHKAHARLRRLLPLSVGLLAVAAIVAATRSGMPAGPPAPGTAGAARSGDPFVYEPARQSAFVARATAGRSQVLFTMSPGGVLATAARVAAFRGMINRVAQGSGSTRRC